MTLGAGQTHPEEQLCDVFHLLSGRGDFTEPCRGRVCFGISGGREYRANELVIGHVLAQSAADPAVKAVRVLDVGRLTSFIAKYGGPFVGEIVGVARAVHQSVDQGISFCRAGVCSKLLSFLRRGQATGQIDADASNKGLVITEGSWGNPELSESGKHECVDEVIFGRR